MNVEAYMKDVINIANKGYMSSQLSRILSDPIGNQINKSSINKVANLTSGSKKLSNYLFSSSKCT